MDLQELLKKNSGRFAKVTENRKKVEIATDDRPYNSTESETAAAGGKEATESKNIEHGVSSALASRKDGVSSKLVQRELGVSSALGDSYSAPEPNELGVSSALATPLGRRHVGVRKIENSALVEGALVGAEKALVSWIAEECRRVGSLQTNLISTEDLRNLFCLDGSALRNLIHRVKQKGFIEVEAKQLGRNGLRTFKISQKTYQEFLTSALVRREPGVSSPLSQALGQALVTPPVVVVSSNSSSSDLKNNNASDELTIPESLIKLGLSRSSLRNSRLTTEEIQTSLDAFAFDLQAGRVKTKSGPLAFLLGIVVKNSTPYVSDRFLGEQEKEVQGYLQRVRNLSEEKAKQVELEKAIAFEKWLEETPEKDLIEFLPPTEIAPKGSNLWTVMLKAKFFNPEQT